MATVAELLQAGLEHHRAGRLAQAEPLYRQVLAADPRQADAWRLLGVIAHTTGHHQQALGCLNRALELDASQPSYHFDRAEVHRSLGHLEQAESGYEHVLRLNPGHAQAHNNLGTLLQGRGLVTEAERHYREALRLRPGYAVAANNLGTVLLKRGDLTDARAQFQDALRAEPAYVEAHNNLGATWQREGELARARACFEEALRLRPEYASALLNLGMVWHAEGGLAQAVECFQRALRLKPDLPEAHYNLGAVFKDMIQFTEAERCLEQALRLRPDYVEALSLLGTIFELQGRVRGAETTLDKALALKPSDALRLKSALLLPVIYESIDDLRSWRTRIEAKVTQLCGEPLTIPDPDHSSGAGPFFLAYQGLDDRDLQTKVAGIFFRAAPELHYVAPHCVPGSGGREPHKPIRVGFLSSYFHHHTIGKLNIGFVQHLSRSDFRVILFRFPGPDDPLARLFQSSADAVVTLPRTLARARQLIAEQQLDVLFYTDIGMNPLTYFLAFSRLAPVQCVTWGHPLTTGIPTMDYFLSNVHLEPDGGAAHYTEELVRTPHVNSYYYHPKLTGAPKTRKEFGLDEDAHLYVCPQTLYKLHPEFDALLGAILRADPKGRVVFISGLHTYWDQLVIERFRRTIPDVAERVQFIPKQSYDDFLKLQVVSDVLLDTIHFGGGNTSYEALAFGTPIVTLPGGFLRSRITYACYQQMGVLDCVAKDPDDYVRIALRLGTDAAWREEVKAKILAAKSVLYENVAVVRELEDFFRRAVERTRAG